MYSHSDIQDAVDGGALTAEQAASLRNFHATRTGTPTPDEEHVRLLQGFHDLYIYISSIVLMVGVAWLGSKINGDRGSASFLIPLLIALTCWGLSEFFQRRKRLALSGILLAWVFVYAVFIAVGLLGSETLEMGSDYTSRQLVTAVAAAVGAAAAFLHWKRFAEPIAVSLIVGMLAITIMALISAVMPRDPDSMVTSIILIVLGLATLFYGQVWDAKDLNRTTSKSDIAFWLHMTASWELFFGVAGLLGLMGYVSQGEAIGAIIVFLVMALIGIILDRRIYVLVGAWILGIGIHALLRGDPMSAYSTYGGDYGSSYGYSPYGMGMFSSVDNVMLTCLIVGVVLIVIGMFWSQIRGGLSGLAGPFAGKVPLARQPDAAPPPPPAA